jgi:hypothetical protein
MDAVIAAAVADVAALGLSTNTPAGQKALVEAIERRLSETKATIADGSSAAATQAASAGTAAAGYNGIAPASAAPAGLPMMGGVGGMPMMGGAGLPMMGGGAGLPMMPTSALQGLSGLSGLMAGHPGAGGAVAERAQVARGVATPGDESAPGRANENGLQKYTKLMNRAISAAFPEITDIGGVRPDTLKWHRQGLALDVMIPGWDTPQGKALGERVVNFLITNKQRLGLDHMIWRQHMIQPDGSSSLMENRGSPTENHMNHVHCVSIGGGN